MSLQQSSSQPFSLSFLVSLILSAGPQPCSTSTLQSSLLTEQKQFSFLASWPNEASFRTQKRVDGWDGYKALWRMNEANAWLALGFLAVVRWSQGQQGGLEVASEGLWGLRLRTGRTSGDFTRFHRPGGGEGTRREISRCLVGGNIDETTWQGFRGLLVEGGPFCLLTVRGLKQSKFGEVISPGSFSKYPLIFWIITLKSYTSLWLCFEFWYSQSLHFLHRLVISQIQAWSQYLFLNFTERCLHCYIVYWLVSPNLYCLIKQINGRVTFCCYYYYCFLWHIFSIIHYTDHCQ